jgi:hypothetical protein
LREARDEAVEMARRPVVESDGERQALAEDFVEIQVLAGTQHFDVDLEELAKLLGHRGLADHGILAQWAFHDDFALRSHYSALSWFARKRSRGSSNTKPPDTANRLKD